MKFPQDVEKRRGAVAAEIRNISLGGAFVCCSKPLGVGEVFRMTIIGPDRELVRATAKVVRSNANAPFGKVINRGMGGPIYQNVR
jgi:hypothetical protein